MSVAGLDRVVRRRRDLIDRLLGPAAAGAGRAPRRDRCSRASRCARWRATGPARPTVARISSDERRLPSRSSYSLVYTWPDHDHRCALAQRGAHPGDQLAPAVDGDEQRVARLPAAVAGAAARVAGHPELDDLLVADLAALGVVDDVTDDGKRGFEHWLIPSRLLSLAHGRSGGRVTALPAAIQPGATDRIARQAAPEPAVPAAPVEGTATVDQSAGWRERPGASRRASSASIAL